MKYIATTVPFLFCIIFSAFSQSVTAKLGFTQGQVFQVTMDTKTSIAQQAMGNSIDFNVNATALHTYRVTNATEDNSTLHHEVKRIQFSFEGMGPKRTFDSDKEKDMNGPFGKPIKDMKDKPYDMVVDTTGVVLMSFPEKIKTTEFDSRMAIITNMLGDVFDIVQPPAKGANSFFRVLPAGTVDTGSTWKENYKTENGQASFIYKLAAVTDSSIVVTFTGKSSSVVKSEMMGNEATTTLNHTLTGTILLDPDTYLLKEKTVNVEGTGNSVSGFGTLPLTTKTTINIKAAPEAAE